MAAGSLHAAWLLVLVLGANTIAPVLDSSSLGVAEGSVRFLAGRPLEQLKVGAAVPFDLQLTLWSGSAVVGRAAGRFVVSYDLWEERFSVAHLGPDGRNAAESARGQTAGDAESWCLRRLRVPAPRGGARCGCESRSGRRTGRPRRRWRRSICRPPWLISSAGRGGRRGIAWRRRRTRSGWRI